MRPEFSIFPTGTRPQLFLLYVLVLAAGITPIALALRISPLAQMKLIVAGVLGVFLVLGMAFLFFIEAASWPRQRALSDLNGAHPSVFSTFRWGAGAGFIAGVIAGAAMRSPVVTTGMFSLIAAVAGGLGTSLISCKTSTKSQLWPPATPQVSPRLVTLAKIGPAFLAAAFVWSFLPLAFQFSQIGFAIVSRPYFLPMLWSLGAWVLTFSAALLNSQSFTRISLISAQRAYLLNIRARRSWCADLVLIIVFFVASGGGLLLSSTLGHYALFRTVAAVDANIGGICLALGIALALIALIPVFANKPASNNFLLTSY